MKYVDWLLKIKELQKKSSKMLVDEDILSETVIIEQKTYGIYLGDNIGFKIEDKDVSEYDFRSIYTAKEPAWQTLLGGLETKVTMAQELDTLLKDAVAEKYMKDAVLERLTGNEDISDNETIILKAKTKRIEKLAKLLPSTNYSFTASFKLPSPSKNYVLEVSFKYDNREVHYGGLPGNGIKTCWSFLQHYDQIEATVKQFAEYFKPIARMCKDADK